MAKANVTLLIRNDVAANWATKNPILKKGEMGYDYDNHLIKIGDGATHWNDLESISSNVQIKTTAAWQVMYNYIPRKGEIIIYTDKGVGTDGITTVPGIKIGDGTSYGIDLPFVGDEIAASVLDHINNIDAHVSNADRIFWNNKINCSTEIVDETLILNRL